MALIRSYAVWNNKGGVGKSTIRFHLAARFAENNRNINVLVIDACPQAPDATAGTLFAAYQNHPQYFTPRNAASNTVAAFRDNYSVALRDFNTAGVVAAHLGRRLSAMTGGYYQVHGQNVQINSARVTECVNAVDALLAMIN